MANVSSSNSLGVSVPKLRFPEFEGEWVEKCFSDLANGFDYGMNVAACEFDGSNRYIRITDIDDNTHEYIDSCPVSPDGEMNEKYIVKEHDILFARTGASTGKTYLYDKKDGILYFAGFLIRVNVNVFNDSYFVFNLTLTDKYSNWVKITSMRSGQPGINAIEYAAYKTYVPQIDEQHKITSFLQLLDKKIKLQKQLIESLKLYKRGLLSKLFPQKGESVPQYRFAGFTDAWEQRRLGDCCEQIKKSVDPQQTPDKIFAEYSMPAFDNENGPDIVSGYEMNSIRKIVDTPCLLINKLNVRKKRIWMVEKPENNAVCSAEFVPIYSNGVNLKYIKYIVLEDKFTKYLEDCSSGSSNSQKRVTPDVIMDAKIMIPKIDEQLKIGEFFDNLDHLITLHQQKYSKMQSFKKFMLQNMFV